MTSRHNSGSGPRRTGTSLPVIGPPPPEVSQSQPWGGQKLASGEEVSFAPGSAVSSPLPPKSVEGMSWKDLVVAAKAARDKGNDQEARKLYNLGLARSVQENGVPRSELVQFLRNNLWA